MKKFSILMLSFLAIAGFNSCDDTDSEEFSLNTNTSGEITLSPEVNTFEVTETNGADLAERFSWNRVSLETPVQIDYQLEMDVESGDYSTPAVLGSNNGTNTAVTYNALNDAALSLGAEPGVATNYKLRVKATTAATAVDPIFSNEVTAVITAFEAYPFSPLYFVGAATEPGWNNGDGNGETNPALFVDVTDVNKHYYTGFFNADEFKILSTLGMWQPQYGERNGAVGVNDGAGSDPASFAAATAGYYDFTIDITGVTNASEGTSSFSMVANTTAATATTYTSIGLIGPSTPNGWTGPDVDLTQSSFDPHQWVGRDIVLIAGELKIRANDDWTDSWGDNVSPYAGQGANSGDPNINAKGGTYDIFFNDLDGSFLLIPQE